MKEQVDLIYTKYLGQIVNVEIDRPLNSKHPKHGFTYELNYGFIPNTTAPDGEEIDAYVIGVNQPVKEFTGKCVAIIHRLNDEDDKLIVVPEGSEIDDKQIERSTNFQEKFFKSIIFRGDDN